jgi:cytochrome c-type biogenesis protein CcmH
MTLITILFILLAAILLLPSQLFVQKKNLQAVEDSLSTRMQQLKQDFQFRTKELARRLKSNELAQEEWQALTSELQLDTTAAIESTKKASNASLSGTSPLTAIILLILSLAIGIGMYQYSGGKAMAEQQIEMLERLKSDPETITKIAKQMESTKDNAVDSKQILEELFLALRSQIDIHPNDASVWRAFAMFSTRVGRNEEAATALNRAMRLEPNNVDIQVELAQLYASSKDPKEKMIANRILFRVIEQYPEHEGARLILGFNSFNLGFYDVAIKSWKAILAKRDPGTSSAKMLERSIDTAQKKLDERLSGQLAKHQSEIGSEDSTSDVEQLSQTSGKSNSSSISVSLIIPEFINANLTGNETLFVFAKAVGGPRFPVAVVKLKLNDLHGEVVLSDANAMQAQFSLSKYAKVEVSARISLSGNAIATTGDFNSDKVMLEAPFTNTKAKLSFVQPQ